MTTRPTERRSHPRVTIKLVVDVALGQTAPKRLAVAKDLSLGGVFIETAKPPAIGGSVVIGIAPDRAQNPLLLPGTVRWSSPTGFGVEFGSLGGREARTVMELVRRH